MPFTSKRPFTSKDLSSSNRSLNGEGPDAKKAKKSPSSPPKQSSLHHYFKPAKPAASNDSDKNNESDANKKSAVPQSTQQISLGTVGTNTNTDIGSNDVGGYTSKNGKDKIPDPIIPNKVSPDPRARWKVVKNCMLVRCISKEEPRQKAAAFDVDGTILTWRIAGWPSQLEHYELWNSTLISKLQKLHDEQAMKLVLFSNQGAVRSAFEGKKATHVKALFEWIAKVIDRPVHVVLSTNKKLGYHKPNPGMWEICEHYCNRGNPLDVNSSFFVGDSVGDDDPQGGVDQKFAANVGSQKGGTLKFYTPNDFFGPSDSNRRKLTGILADYDDPPSTALQSRQQLLGGYLQGPLVLLLSGVQGSGKSTLCEEICRDDNSWVHYSQDTINKGKPGTREAVEERTYKAIRAGRSVIVDRTHLDPSQRRHFVDIAKEMNVPVHVLVLQPPKEIIAKRVRERTNHPGRVEGEGGVRLAMAALAKAIQPKYSEEFDLITFVKRDDGIHRMAQIYRRVLHADNNDVLPTLAGVVERRLLLSCGTMLPTLTLGTMSVSRRVASGVVRSALEFGWEAVDTAPTYNNEQAVGEGVSACANKDIFVVAKVPKRAMNDKQVFEELNTSLVHLNLKKADLLLLHWPSDVIEAGTLESVWRAMEKCVTDEKVRALGVCNFSVNALRQLLPLCKILPAVNQVERHPLLPQLELLEFCMNQDIFLQAHTPLGHGKLLSHDTIVQVAKDVKKSPAQVLLQWNLMHGVANVCKSSTSVHQQEIASMYKTERSFLSARNMRELDSISETKRFVNPPFMRAPGNPLYTWED